MQSEINLPFVTADATAQTPADDPDPLQAEQLTGDLIERTIEPCRQALADAKLKSRTSRKSSSSAA